MALIVLPIDACEGLAAGIYCPFLFVFADLRERFPLLASDSCPSQTGTRFILKIEKLVGLIV
ncbi:hypothetical protein DS909_22170 [Phaeobacter gallaeciensis]|uniref:Uncharacterized protein n=1 Tax=Phaeobacter gallaeciensis TaxID=60890 RepID=A0A366WL07_9RHOB|nr:hypothetical protein DS909_22170 [Phaeobacter gallaeciensis]